MALSGTLLLVPALLLAQNRNPAAAHVKAGPAPSFAAPDRTADGTVPVLTTPTSAVPVAPPVPATSPPASALVLTPAVAVLPTTSSTAAPTTWRTTTTARRTLVTAPPTTRATTTTAPPPPPTTAPPTHSETGQASWYNAPAGSCASPTLPLGTVITVTNLANGATATCTVEGRGPYGGGNRIVDLDQTTFAKLAPLAQGVINVRITW